MKNKFIVKIKVLICVVIVLLFIWFLVISPMITFHSNEEKLEKAARRYFELNSDKLPIGERVKTLSLSDLYKGSYLDSDFKVPYSGKMCSVEKSWVKVKNNNGEYKYYIYLDCEVDDLTYTVMYAHLYPNSAKVEVGDEVKAGDELAGVGTTGYSTGPHLHFQVMLNGEKVDGMSLIDFSDYKQNNLFNPTFEPVFDPNQPILPVPYGP